MSLFSIVPLAKGTLLCATLWSSQAPHWISPTRGPFYSCQQLFGSLLNQGPLIANRPTSRFVFFHLHFLSLCSIRHCLVQCQNVNTLLDIHCLYCEDANSSGKTGYFTFTNKVFFFQQPITFCTSFCQPDKHPNNNKHKQSKTCQASVWGIFQGLS